MDSVALDPVQRLGRDGDTDRLGRMRDDRNGLGETVFRIVEIFVVHVAFRHVEPVRFWIDLFSEFSSFCKKIVNWFKMNDLKRVCNFKII